MSEILPITSDMFFTALFGVLVLTFLVHALIAMYHWFTFGSSRSLSAIATTVYLGGGGFLLLLMGLALIAIT